MKADWKQQYQAIKDLMDYLDEKIPTINADSTAGSVFMGATALYRCNRLLRAIDNAIDQGLGDTAGGNVRTLYDTWVLGHLIMLSDLEGARALWAMTRGQAEKLLKSMGVADQVEYPEVAPEAADDKGVQQRAVALGKKLKSEDPNNAHIPEYCYDNLYRAESHLSAHANLDAINQYVKPVGQTDGIIGVNGKNEGVEWRVKMAAYITAYFASQVFKKADIKDPKFENIERRLDPPKAEKKAI